MNCFLSGFLVFIALNSWAEMTADPKFEAERESMIKMSRQLGITCAYCHDVKNYKNGSMKTFKVAKAHQELVSSLNKQYRGKISNVDCFMCHRGKAVPDFVEKIDKF